MKHRFLQNNWGILLLTAILMVVILLCLSFRQEPLPLSVTVTVDGQSRNLACQQVSPGEYYVFLPSFVTMEQVSWAVSTDTAVTVGGKPVENGGVCAEFQPEQAYALRWAQGEGTLTFAASAHVATLYLDTQSGSMDYIHAAKGNEETGNLALYTADGTLDYAGSMAQLKGRGNYSWEAFDKKPYSLTLAAEADLLGMGKAGEWILLSNAADPSLLKNKMVCDFAHTVGMAYSPACQWVDVYLNGRYAGLYLLCERNEIHENRVAGDWLVSLELESRLIAQNYPHISLASGQALRVHDPESPDLIALAEQWQQVEDSLATDDWQTLIDGRSWAQKYLAEEIFASIDGCLISQYFYGVEGRVYAGPVWDFDISMGDPDAWQTTYPKTFFANLDRYSGDLRASWFYDLYQKPEFYGLLTQIYQEEFLPALETLLDTGVAEYVEQIEAAYAMDRLRWGSGENLRTCAGEITDYLRRRVDFLTEVWVEGKNYCYVYTDHEWGGCYAVESGDCLTALPVLEDTENARFVGWYHADTHEPFDPMRPVNRDLRLYAKWENISGGMGGKLLMLLPLGAMGILMLGLLALDHKKNGEKRVAEHG